MIRNLYQASIHNKETGLYRASVDKMKPGGS